MIEVVPDAAIARARQSLGSSAGPIYEAVASALVKCGGTGVLVDVGSGSGNLWRIAGHRFGRYIGLDLVRYDGFPSDAEFHQVDLERTPLPLADRTADVVAAIETIEHLENPRAFVRELVRIVRPGGWVVITTPNQLSLLSIATLVIKQRFSAFQDSAYPAHRTALLEVDLQRIASECGLQDLEVLYTRSGRIPLTGRHYPRAVSAVLPRLLSDNVILIGRRPR